MAHSHNINKEKIGTNLGGQIRSLELTIYQIEPPFLLLAVAGLPMALDVGDSDSAAGLRQAASQSAARNRRCLTADRAALGEEDELQRTPAPRPREQRC